MTNWRRRALISLSNEPNAWVGKQWKKSGKSFQREACCMGGKWSLCWDYYSERKKNRLLKIPQAYGTNQSRSWAVLAVPSKVFFFCLRFKSSFTVVRSTCLHITNHHHPTILLCPIFLMCQEKVRRSPNGFVRNGNERERGGSGVLFSYPFRFDRSKSNNSDLVFAGFVWSQFFVRFQKQIHRWKGKYTVEKVL